MIQPFVCVHVDCVATGCGDDPADGSTGSLTGENHDSNQSFPWFCDVWVDLYNHVLIPKLHLGRWFSLYSACVERCSQSSSACNSRTAVPNLHKTTSQSSIYRPYISCDRVLNGLLCNQLLGFANQKRYINSKEENQYQTQPPSPLCYWPATFIKKGLVAHTLPTTKNNIDHTICFWRRWRSKCLGDEEYLHVQVERWMEILEMVFSKYMKQRTIFDYNQCLAPPTTSTLFLENKHQCM